MQGASTGYGRDVARQRGLVAAFLAAARGGDFDALFTMLDPETVLRLDEPPRLFPGATQEAHGAAREMRGATAIATKPSAEEAPWGNAGARGRRYMGRRARMNGAGLVVDGGVTAT